MSELSWSWLALSLGPVAPLALWQWLWPVHLPPTVWVWWDRGHGRPPAPLSNLPPPNTLTSPQASCSGPRICTALPGGPQDTQLDPFTYTHVHGGAHKHTHTLTIPTHMLGKPLYKWKPYNTHGYTGGLHEKTSSLSRARTHTHTHIVHVCQPFNIQPLQAQVFPTAPYNGLSSQGWDTNRWRCFLY